MHVMHVMHVVFEVLVANYTWESQCSSYAQDLHVDDIVSLPAQKALSSAQEVTGKKPPDHMPVVELTTPVPLKVAPGVMKMPEGVDSNVPSPLNLPCPVHVAFKKYSVSLRRPQCRELVLSRAPVP